MDNMSAAQDRLFTLQYDFDVTMNHYYSFQTINQSFQMDKFSFRLLVSTIYWAVNSGTLRIIEILVLAIIVF